MEKEFNKEKSISYSAFRNRIKLYDTEEELTIEGVEEHA